MKLLYFNKCRTIYIEAKNNLSIYTNKLFKTEICGWFRAGNLNWVVLTKPGNRSGDEGPGALN
jgi:hypothetical protein